MSRKKAQKPGLSCISRASLRLFICLLSHAPGSRIPVPECGAWIEARPAAATRFRPRGFGPSDDHRMTTNQLPVCLRAIEVHAFRGFNRRPQRTAKGGEHECPFSRILAAPELHPGASLLRSLLGETERTGANAFWSSSIVRAPSPHLRSASSFPTAGTRAHFPPPPSVHSPAGVQRWQRVSVFSSSRD